MPQSTKCPATRLADGPQRLQSESSPSAADVLKDSNAEAEAAAPNNMLVSKGGSGVVAGYTHMCRT